MGIMTLAVMSRASLGHTGRALVATASMQGIYLLLVIGCARPDLRGDPSCLELARCCMWREAHGP